MDFDIGTIIRDGDKIGIVRNIIIAGTWTEEPLFNWTTSYEIVYDDQAVCIMTRESLIRLIQIGRVEVIVK